MLFDHGRVTPPHGYLGFIRVPSNDSAFLLRAKTPTAHAVCDSDADPASSKGLLDSAAEDSRMEMLLLKMGRSKNLFIRKRHAIGHKDQLGVVIVVANRR